MKSTTAGSTLFFRCAVLLSLLSAVFAHTSLNEPIPRGVKQTYVFDDNAKNSCENPTTAIPKGQKVYQRGGVIKNSWFWNNHKGGFIKYAIVDIASFVKNQDVLNNQNIVNGQCYLRPSCQSDSGFDPGNTKLCFGADIVVPTYLKDGTYVLHFSSFGGFDSNGNPKELLPTYHNCANIQIKGGKALTNRPAKVVAPFISGNKDVVKGAKAPAGQCAFKEFSAEPANAKLVNVNKNKNSDNDIKFGPPQGWAAVGNTLRARQDAVYLPKLGHVARTAVAKPPTHEEEETVE